MEQELLLRDAGFAKVRAREDIPENSLVMHKWGCVQQFDGKSWKRLLGFAKEKLVKGQECSDKIVVKGLWKFRWEGKV